MIFRVSVENSVPMTKLEVRTITCTTRESRRSAVMEMLKTIKSAGLIF